MTTLLSQAFYQRKIAQIQQALATAGLKGILLLDAPNVIYVSGFFHIPSERPLGCFIPQAGSPVLFVPLLEQENAAAAWSGEIRTYFEYPGEEHAVLWMVRECGVQPLAIDHIEHELFRRLPSSVQTSDLVDRLRWVKEPEELALIEQAAGYADYCLEQVRDHAADIIGQGGTELDILKMCLAATTAKMQAEVGQVFKLRGGAVVGTVHSGARAALPHGSPLSRQPQPGEPIIAGIGANVGGYHAESGATFVYGDPPAEVLRCLHAAAACDAATVAALRPGATCAAVNEAALAVLRDRGLGAAIRHRIGHGMGLQGHEAPWLAPGDLTVCQPGMVFSCEPGIYRPGVDGYRTINTLIVTDAAARVPSRFLAQHPPEKRILAR
ncbi:MAG: Xaa-Pro peptidase family protein [Anaerolineae bacterium]|nr:Xaa-Pro peptidase family protein [Anaerolineae bacterium]